MHTVCQQNREISITKFCQHLQTRSTGNARRFSCFFCCLSADNRNRTKRPLPSGNCLQYGISFCTNRHGIRCVFHIAAQKHSAVCSLQGWVNSHESVRFVAINDHTAIITGEYNMEQVKVWLEKYTSIRSLKTS